MSTQPRQLATITALFSGSIFLQQLIGFPLNAAETPGWKLLRPIGGHFSVRVPKLVPTLDVPNPHGVKMRSWSSESGRNQYLVVAMYSANADFKDLIADPKTMNSVVINGTKMSELVSPKTKSEPARRRLFYSSAHHAAMFEEFGPEMPSANDEFFKSIQIEENRVVPMTKITDAKSGLSFLFPREHVSDHGFWTGADNDCNYMAEVTPNEKPSEQERLDSMEDFANEVGKSRSEDKVTKVSGFPAREFFHGHSKYLMVQSPTWCYTFSCYTEDDSPNTLKAQENFFNSIAIKNHPNS